MNISGILVQTKPENLAEVIAEIKSKDLWEYHLHDQKGRIVITIEGASTDEEIKKLNALKRLKYVIAADMVYSYSEDELDELRENIEKNSNVPDWLNNPDIKAEHIKYNGDLKKRY